MPGARSDALHAAHQADRRREVFIAIVAELTIVVAAPHPKRAVPFDCERVVIAARRGQHIAEHDCRRGAVGAATITELPGIVGAPGPEIIVGADDHRVLVTCAYRS